MGVSTPDAREARDIVISSCNPGMGFAILPLNAAQYIKSIFHPR